MAIAQQPNPASRPVAHATLEALRRHRDNDWPRCSRPLPWAVAGFIALVFLLPLNRIELAVTLPVDSKIDRFALVGLIGMWLFVRGVHRAERPRLVPTLADPAALAVAVAFTLSVIVNLPVLAYQNEIDLAVKKLLLLASYLALLYIVATVIRPGEVRAFSLYVMGLATVAAIGTIYEYRSGTNVFYDLADSIPGASVGPRPVGEAYERQQIVGPTSHGLSDATLLMTGMGIALVGLIGAWGHERRRRVICGVCLLLLIAGSAATLRKTAVILPAVTVVTVVALRPRQFVRLWPLGLVVLAVVGAAAPGAVSSLRSTFSQGTTSTSSAARTSDYEATAPDVRANPAFGRGFGSYDPQKYRILDNQALGLLIETGVVGLAAYLALVAWPLVGMRRVGRDADLARAGPAIAVQAACASFLVSNFLYDAFGFRDSLYAFLIVMGIGMAHMKLLGGPARPRADTFSR